MFTGGSYNNRGLKKREEDRKMDSHLERIKQARPNTTGISFYDQPRALNNGKKNMQIEDKFTEIERENRLLLEKITTTMNKRAVSVSERERPNRSLHGSFRKKQLTNIEVENARMLKRLQERRSSYQTEKLNQNWKKQATMIRNIANFPIVIKDGSRRGRKRHEPRSINLDFDRNSLRGDVEMMRIRNIDGMSMVVTVKLGEVNLTIVGDLKSTKSIKIIEIPREEALEFIQMECEGKIENIFDRLRYDHAEGTLYLFSQGADYSDIGEVEETEEN